MTVKILLDTLRLADDGRVECKMSAPDGTVVEGSIEKVFFEDFMGVPNPKIGVGRLKDILASNLEYFETIADRKWRMGNRELNIS